MALGLSWSGCNAGLRPLLPLLLLCGLLAAGHCSAAGPSCFRPSAPDALVTNGPDVFAETGRIGNGAYYQIRVVMPRTVQVAAIQLRLTGTNPGRLLGRAALYNASSMLLQQSAILNVSAAGLDWLEFPLLEALTVTAGDYSVGFWFDHPSSDGGLTLLCTDTSWGSYMMWRHAPAGLQYSQVNSSLPELLTANGFWYRDSTTLCPLVRLWGSQCARDVQPPAIDLQEVTSSILSRILLKHNKTAGIGAAIVQAPEPGSQRPGMQPSDSLCPHVLLAVAVAGMRR
jgi:hypothetical protein